MLLCVFYLISFESICVKGTGVAGFSNDGGYAIKAMLYYPRGVTSDSLGNLYIADAWNQRVRRVNTNNGIISTAAGIKFTEIPIICISSIAYSNNTFNFF